MQGTQLRYAIKFVADMNKAVKFYRDVLGLQLKFESPGWSEFVTGETTLALHPASDKNPAGKVELGFTVPDVEAFYRNMSAKELRASQETALASFTTGLARPPLHPPIFIAVPRAGRARIPCLTCFQVQNSGISAATGGIPWPK
jgi:catechol 2,3-dioxygenase-like lactoylglutathione lyase family enzyme